MNNRAIGVGERVRLRDDYFPPGSVWNTPPMTGTVDTVERGLVRVDWDEHPYGAGHLRGKPVGPPTKPTGMSWLAAGYVVRLEAQS